MPGSHLVLTILLAPEAVVVGGIAVVETVGQQEIDAGLIPAEGGRFGCFDWFEQQQAAALLGWGQGQLALFDHRLLFRVGISQPGAVGPDPLQRYSDRAAIPLDAGLLGRLTLELTLFGGTQHLEAGGIRGEGELIVPCQHHPQGKALIFGAVVHGLRRAEGERLALARAKAGAATVACIADADLVAPLGKGMGQRYRALVQVQRRGDCFAVHIEMHLGGSQHLAGQQGAAQQGEPEGREAGIATHKPFLEQGVTGPDFVNGAHSRGMVVGMDRQSADL